MALPKPTHQFKIPSVYDGVLLQCRIYHPDYAQGTDRNTVYKTKGAMIAHPYAPLGGCYDDPVIAVVASELLRAGYVVGTFNLRGAGGSQGRTSWTAKPELSDFISFYLFLVHYIVGLDPFLEHDPTLAGNDASLMEDSPCPSIIVSGYSYGSMLARYSPSSRVILSTFQEPKQNEPAYKILQEARSLSSKRNREARVHSCSNESSSSCFGTTVTKTKDINVSYLLISPLLPPITIFTATSLLLPASKLTVTINGNTLPPSDLQDKVLEHQTLAIFGENDGFTSSKKLMGWSDQLKKLEGSRFDSVMVKGAGHFWHEHEAEPRMRRAIQEWIAREASYQSI
ncbi:TPA_exp: Uncharacterized protein A8136_5593 [Trichophyton benhamiae CBS 112371]|uniref:AB hydrolase-1 domain-containing protein n=1 Tax=Arthroderma benhamiae (strain ATCC MYA-4681 / CBS 112371) TaxID=663331 RepID=D4ANY1_ARTBC|nr:uncharacterized protein ARB_05948 [Trichophyton benhamiae CBS 112371]EFE34992.1 conserved hypothetical protein [Trichophyton benhamiae CBS 112371]DAA77890.1 TPA_exp: Uncharacterized protein A8136_5593 [Trichophyton benhamiae CBS 112371]